MSVQSEIEGKLIAWATGQGFKVALENVPFVKPTTGEAYLELDWLGSLTRNQVLAATKEREIGMFQICVCTKSGKGKKKLNEIITGIKVLFPVLPKTGTVSIERPVQVAQGITRDDGWYATPLTISFRQERSTI